MGRRINHHAHFPATGGHLNQRRVEPLRGSAYWLVFVLVCLCLFPLTSVAQAKDEQAVRAAFVFLTKYVEWPAGAADHEIVIGFTGEGSMGLVLTQVLTGKTAGTRTVRVIVEPAKEELPRCNILYSAQSSPQKIRAVLERIANTNILTVGDATSFTRSGGAVGLVTAGDHVQIQINPAAAEAAQIKISSRLLSLATLVNQTAGR
jgi:hypothetical protein